MNDGAESASRIPLVVDMDGTLIKVDSLHEAFVQFTLKSPSAALRAALRVRHGRAAFKAAIPDFALIETGPLPVEETVLEAIRHARECGRKVYLATAADRRFALVVANAVGGFDGIFASERGINLKGQVKADCLIAVFGDGGFDYIGNDVADVPAWRAARAALVSGASPALLKKLRAQVPDLVTLNLRRRAIGDYACALRPHQWLKNALVVVPAIGAPDFSFSSFVTILVAFVSFSLAASSVYLVDDMIDLRQDRLHPRKRYLPIAAGVVPLSHSIALLACASALSIALALLLPSTFMFIIFAYAVLSLSYSIYLKRKLMIDVATLAALYGSRVLAGGAATGIALSHWILALCILLFLFLAFTRRTAEMMAQSVSRTGENTTLSHLSERLQTFCALTAVNGVFTLLVFALYIHSSEAQTLYEYPRLLWANWLLLACWLGRIYFVARGGSPEDPLVSAMTDWVSLTFGGVAATLFLAAL